MEAKLDLYNFECNKIKHRMEEIERRYSSHDSLTLMKAEIELLDSKVSNMQLELEKKNQQLYSITRSIQEIEVKINKAITSYSSIGLSPLLPMTPEKTKTIEGINGILLEKYDKLETFVEEFKEELNNSIKVTLEDLQNQVSQIQKIVTLNSELNERLIVQKPDLMNPENQGDPDIYNIDTSNKLHQNINIEQELPYTPDNIERNSSNNTNDSQNENEKINLNKIVSTYNKQNEGAQENEFKNENANPANGYYFAENQNEEFRIEDYEEDGSSEIIEKNIVEDYIRDKNSDEFDSKNDNDEIQKEVKKDFLIKSKQNIEGVSNKQNVLDSSNQNNNVDNNPILEYEEYSHNIEDNGEDKSKLNEKEERNEALGQMITGIEINQMNLKNLNLDKKVNAQELNKPSELNIQVSGQIDSSRRLQTEEEKFKFLPNTSEREMVKVKDDSRKKNEQLVSDH